MDIQTRDGILLRNVPDGTPDEEIKARIAQIRAGKPAPAPAQPMQPPAAPEPLSTMDKMLGSIPSGIANNPLVTKAKQFVTGAADPVVGTVQAGANLLPDSTGIPQQVNKAIRTKADELQAERGPDAGFDFTRMAGNVLSPVNLAIALKAPMAASTLGRAAQGAGLGAAGGLSTPVENTDNGFWKPKAGQVAVGTAVGGIATPVLGKVADYVAKRVNVGRVSAADASSEAEKAIAAALADVNAKLDDIPKVQLDQLRQQVADSLKSGKQLDAAALMRKSDFEKLGMGDMATAGQITRDPMQWANEFNLRNVRGVGEPISNKVVGATQKLAELVRGYGGPEAKQAAEAGRTIAAPLAAIDKESKVRADLLYQGFRDLAPDVTVPDPARFSNTLLKKLDDAQVQSNLSKDWQTRLNKITEGEFPLTPSTLEQMYRNAGDALRGAQGSEKKAYALVKSAIEDEMAGMAATFPRGSDAALAKSSLDIGRKEVAGRYGLREALPAVEAAADGTVPPDAFVKRFVLDAPADQVKKMAALLRKESPEAFQEARNQVGQQLQLKAFGENPAGDSDFLPAGFKRKLADLGDEKLGVFFSADEIDKMKTASRVGAYINSKPNAAVPNYSGTGSAVANLLRSGAGAAVDRIPFVGRPMTALAGVAKDRMAQDSVVKTAMDAAVPAKDLAALTPEQRRLIAQWLAGGAAAGGSILAPNGSPRQ